MDNLLLLLSVLTGGFGIVMVVKGVSTRGLQTRLTSRNILKERLEQKRQEIPPRVPPAPAHGRRNLLPHLTHLLSHTRLRPQMAQLEQALMLAQIPLKPAEFLYITSAALFLALAVVRLTTNSIALALVITLIAGYTPFYYLRLKQRIRFLKLDGQVADTLLLMTNSLRAGASFLDAMDAVAREMPPPISEEFSRALRDISLGVPVDESFVKLSTRCHSEDLDLAVTAFKIQREIGGNLAEILENIAATIRERMKLKQEIRTLSTQGKMSGGILCCLPPGLILVLHTMNPEYLKILFASQEGRVMLILGIVMQLIGVLAISRIVRIDV